MNSWQDKGLESITCSKWHSSGAISKKIYKSIILVCNAI